MGSARIIHRARSLCRARPIEIAPPLPLRLQAACDAYRDGQWRGVDAGLRTGGRALGSHRGNEMKTAGDRTGSDSMTPGQRRWLERLRDDGPQRRPRYGARPCAECKRKGWTAAMWVDHRTGDALTHAQVVNRSSEGCHVREAITDAGREVLSQRPIDGRSRLRAVSLLSRNGLLREMEHAARILTTGGMTCLEARARTAALLRRAATEIETRG